MFIILLQQWDQWFPLPSIYSLFCSIAFDGSHHVTNPQPHPHLNACFPPLLSCHWHPVLPVLEEERREDKGRKQDGERKVERGGQEKWADGKESEMRRMGRKEKQILTFKTPSTAIFPSCPSKIVYGYSHWTACSIGIIGKESYLGADMYRGQQHLTHGKCIWNTHLLFQKHNKYIPVMYKGSSFSALSNATHSNLSPILLVPVHLYLVLASFSSSRPKPSVIYHMTLQYTDSAHLQEHTFPHSNHPKHCISSLYS